MDIKKLLELSKDEAATKRYVQGFPERLKKREAEFAAQAKSQAPTQAFLDRSYDI
jgi:hypothetical protein